MPIQELGYEVKWRVVVVVVWAAQFLGMEALKLRSKVMHACPKHKGKIH